MLRHGDDAPPPGLISSSVHRWPDCASHSAFAWAQVASCGSIEVIGDVPLGPGSLGLHTEMQPPASRQQRTECCASFEAQLGVPSSAAASEPSPRTAHAASSWPEAEGSSANHASTRSRRARQAAMASETRCRRSGKAHNEHKRAWRRLACGLLLSRTGLAPQ